MIIAPFFTLMNGVRSYKFNEKNAFIDPSIDPHTFLIGLSNNLLQQKMTD